MPATMLLRMNGRSASRIQWQRWKIWRRQRRVYRRLLRRRGPETKMRSNIVRHRLVQQLFFALLATVSVAALSVLLITQAVRRAERVVVAETTQALTTANRELEQQYRYRVSSD
jgi:hypothetical protein